MAKKLVSDSTWTTEEMEDCSGSEAESDVSEASGQSTTNADKDVNNDDADLEAALSSHVSHANPLKELEADFTMVYRGAPPGPFEFHKENDKYFIFSDTITGKRCRAVNVADNSDHFGSKYHLLDTVELDRKACSAILPHFTTNKIAADWEIGASGVGPAAKKPMSAKDLKAFKSDKLQFGYSTLHAEHVLERLKLQSAAKKAKRSKKASELASAAQPPAKKPRLKINSPVVAASTPAAVSVPTPASTPAEKPATRTLVGSVHLPTVGITLNNVVFTLNK